MSDKESARKGKAVSEEADPKAEGSGGGNPSGGSKRKASAAEKAGKEKPHHIPQRQESKSRRAKGTAGAEAASGSGASGDGKKTPGTSAQRETSPKGAHKKPGETEPVTEPPEDAAKRGDAASEEVSDHPGAAGGKAEGLQDATGSEERMSEEEFRRLVEESLEKVTVAEIALTMMNQLASTGYLKMGLPESVNLKYRDLEQASLAIDLLEALIKGGEGKIPEELLRPFRGTLANLQMNFVQLRRA